MNENKNREDIFGTDELKAKEECEKRVQRMRSDVYDWQQDKKKRSKGTIAAVIIAAFILGIVVAVFIVVPLINNGIYKANEPKPIESGLSGTSLNNSQEELELGGELPSIIYKDNPVIEISEYYDNIVVSIECRSVKGAQVDLVSSGSGFVISEDGYILTNAHVVKGGTEIIVSFVGGDEYYAKLLGSDDILDVAVLKIDAQGLTAAPIGNSDKVKTGELVVAIGNPYGLGQSLKNTVTVGFIGSAAREMVIEGQKIELIQADAAINPGNSGGPLVNVSGEVIAITNMKTFMAGYDEYGNQINTEGLGFSIPINSAMNAAKQIIRTGNVVKPGIGIYYSMITAENSKIMNIPEGALVRSVNEGGPAEKAGLQQDDVIIACDGVDIKDIEDLSTYIKAKDVGDTVQLTIWRKGEQMNVEVEIIDLNA